MTESEWRALRALHRVALDRYCAQVLEECGRVVTDTNGSAHERYLRLYRLVRERDDTIAAAFNDMRRSRALQRLAAMIALGTVTTEELSQFSVGTRESATELADMLWGSGGRQKVPAK